MDNLAHSLVGLALAKAGLEKVSPGATTICLLSANAPDLDFISALSGDRWTVLHYHRGITHSLLGTLLLALFLPAVFCAADLVISRLRRQPRRLRFLGLLAPSLIAGATHPLLDWTNNYGVRPLLPWSGEWFYGDLVFVVDPVLWLVLGAAGFLLTSKTKGQIRFWALLGAALTALFLYAGAIQRRVDHGPVVFSLWILAVAVLVLCYRLNLGERFGRKLAVAALVVLLAYWGGLGVLHGRAMAMAAGETNAMAAKHGERVMRIAAMPTLVNPTRWRCVAETDRAVYRFDVFLTNPAEGAVDARRFPKPDEAESATIELAKRDRRAQRLIEFARFPVARVVDPDCRTETVVQFADIRYTEPGKAGGAFSLDVAVPCNEGRKE